MDDLSLEDLQAALQSVQERKTATRLSERNVVELVTKLRESGLLGNDLLHSINGKEYITASHLCKEVRAVVTQSGGRIAVVDLPAQLGVDITHCERQAQEAVAQSNEDLQIVQGEIMSEGYFDSVATEIDELLQESSVLAFSEIAKRFKLSAELVNSTISSRLGTIINGRIEAGILYTAAYIARIKAMLRGGLRGAFTPVNLSSLVKRWEIQTTSTTAQTVTALVEELISENAVFGVLKQGTGTFVPAVFALNQQKAVHSFYAQNAYIEYSMLEKMGISTGRSYMEAAFPDGVAMEAAFVAPQLQAQLEAAVEEAVASGSWIDGQTVVPSAIGIADATTLLHKSAAACCKGQSREGAPQIFSGTCLVAAGLLSELQEKALAAARDAADSELKRRRASVSAASSSPVPESSGPSQSVQTKAASAAADNGSDDEWDTGKGKKKKGGKRRAAAKGKTSQPSAAASQGSKPKQGAPPAAVAGEILSVAVLTEKVEEWLPDAVGAGESSGFTEALADHVRPAALVEFDRSLNAVFLAGAEARRRKRESLAKLAEDSFLRLQLFKHGAELVKDDEATSSALQRHLLRGLGQQVLDLILRHHKVESQEERNDDSSGAQPAAGLLSAAERAGIVRALPPDLATPVSAAEKALNGADSEVAMEALQATARAFGLLLRHLDKKTEKALVLEHRAALQGKLAGQENAAEALSLVVPALAAQVHGVAMSIPGKALAGVIARLEQDLPAEAFKQLSEFHGLVVQSLRSQSEQSDPQMEALLPSIKGLAGAPQAAAAGP